VELLILVLIYLLSWFSAQTVARSWLDARAAGRWAMPLCWAGAILSALGFTWCYLMLVLVAAHSFGLVVSTWVQVVAGIGGLLLASLAASIALLVPVYCRLQAARARVFAQPALGWKKYEGAALAATLPEVGRGSENRDSDMGTMVVLYALLATTTILGFVQTYLMIRAGVADAARQIAGDYRRLVSDARN
jgi:hypothetical protein